MSRTILVMSFPRSISEMAISLSIYTVTNYWHDGVCLVEDIVPIILGVEAAESVIVAPNDAMGIAQQACPTQGK